MRETPRILIVDDDRSIGTIIERSLTRHGFAVDATSSADATAYDAALVDLVMLHNSDNRSSVVAAMVGACEAPPSRQSAREV